MGKGAWGWGHRDRGMQTGACRRECGDRSVGTGVWGREHGDGSMGLGVWGQENFFLTNFFQKIFFSSNDLIFHTGMEVWGGE